jgi:hypothetical protein
LEWRGNNIDSTSVCPAGSISLWRKLQSLQMSLCWHKTTNKAHSSYPLHTKQSRVTSYFEVSDLFRPKCPKIRIGKNSFFLYLPVCHYLREKGHIVSLSWNGKMREKKLFLVVGALQTVKALVWEWILS